MKKLRFQAHAAAWLLGLLLSGCGGGSDVPTAETTAPIGANTAPIALANAVPPTVAGTTVTLDGSGSTDGEGDALTFDWRVDGTPSGDTVQLQGAATARPAFVPNQAGPYTFQLAVGDGHTTSAPVKVTVDVRAPALPATPAFTLPEGGRLLDAEGSQALYSLRPDDTAVALRNLDTGMESTLTVLAGRDWQLSRGRVYAQATLAAGAQLEGVFRWNADGTVSNLWEATRGPWPDYSRFNHPVARGGYVVWAGTTTAYKEADDTFQHLPLPAGTVLDEVHKDLAVVDGVAHFVYSGGLDGGFTSNIVHWNSATNTLAPVTTNGPWDIVEHPLTDGNLVVWKKLGDPFPLFLRSLAGGDTVQLSSTAQAYLLRSGVVAWQERRSPDQTAVMARTSAGTFTLGEGNAVLLANDGGQVIYRSGNSVSSWNAATRRHTPRVEATPDQAIITNGFLVFTVGRSVYRLPL